jgi:cation:H+ antiporter
MQALLEHFTVAIFIVCLALVVISSFVLSTALDRVGAWLRFSAGLLGIVTALGTDSPEISSAITALTSGNREIGLGVVLGSNLFNLASLLGLSAVVAGKVRARAAVVIFNGGVSLAVLVVTALLICGVIDGALGLGLMALIFVPYAVVSSLHPQQVEALRLLPVPVRRFFAIAVGPAERRDSAEHDETEDAEVSAPLAAMSSAMFEALTLVPALVAIVIGSIGMVYSALILGNRWHVPQTLIGVLVLAALTGIPNAVAAVRLALMDNGPVIVSEALNSNTLNLIVGIGVPALVIGLGPVTRFTLLTLVWLIAMTVAVLGLMLRGGKLGRGEGIAVIVAWIAFAAVTIVIASG